MTQKGRLTVFQFMHFLKTDCFEYTQQFFTNIFAACFQNCQKTKILHYSHSFASKLHDCEGHMRPPTAVFHLILLVQLWLPIGLAMLYVQNILWITLGMRTQAEFRLPENSLEFMDFFHLLLVFQEWCHSNLPLCTLLLGLCSNGTLRHCKWH